MGADKSKLFQSAELDVLVTGLVRLYKTAKARKIIQCPADFVKQMDGHKHKFWFIAKKVYVYSKKRREAQVQLARIEREGRAYD